MCVALAVTLLLLFAGLTLLRLRSPQAGPNAILLADLLHAVGHPSA